ncbi:cystinosin-like protein [Saccharomycopsis crataegensis]|uniref:Cystinosin-like protein n=1 Tax=Saccharomycopsis crataegensis TaxID=43959 RepID=A0AAV5QPU7_9ASCO|nr:cystinosin-like protein [Saccharomycopsis crataegensis]
MSFLKFLSNVFGITYVCLWSSAFYPTLLMNYKLKSSDAISLDSLLLNVIGYFSYFITIYLQLFDTNVIADYEKVYKTKPILSMIDFGYALHCLLCITVTFFQVVYYRVLKLKSYHDPSTRAHNPGDANRFSITGDLKYIVIVLRKINISTKYSIIILLIFLGTCLYRAFITESLPLLFLTKILTMVKLFINCIKFVPQLLLNYKNKSVKGYPFLAIYLDLAGGMMSFCQIILDNYMILLQWKSERPINRMGIEIDHSLHFSFFDFVKKNFAKCGLVLVGFFFDFCFLSQKRMYEKNNDLLPSNYNDGSVELKTLKREKS